MTREERAKQLNRMRQTDPKRLIATYKATTETLEMPRGLGFTGMIEAILEHEFGQLASETQEIANTSICQRTTTPSLAQDAQRRRPTLMAELRALCSGVAMVGTGLAMAALYLLVAH